MAVTGKIDRKYMAHYIDAGSLCGGLTPKYERLGKDLEEYNVELNPDTETSKTFLENPHSSITATKFLPTLIRFMQTLLLICLQHCRRL